MNKLIKPEAMAKELTDMINKAAKELPKSKRQQFYQVICNDLQTSLGMFPASEFK